MIVYPHQNNAGNTKLTMCQGVAPVLLPGFAIKWPNMATRLYQFVYLCFPNCNILHSIIMQQNSDITKYYEGTTVLNSQYGAVYPFPLWWLSKYTLCLIIIIKSEVWTIIHCLQVRSWNNGMRCMSLYILILTFSVFIHSNSQTDILSNCSWIQQWTFIYQLTPTQSTMRTSQNISYYSNSVAKSPQCIPNEYNIFLDNTEYIFVHRPHIWIKCCCDLWWFGSVQCYPYLSHWITAIWETMLYANCHKKAMQQIIKWITMQCHYNAVNVLQKHHNRHPIARPLGRNFLNLDSILHCGVIIDIL